MVLLADAILLLFMKSFDKYPSPLLNHTLYEAGTMPVTLKTVMFPAPGTMSGTQ